MVRTWLSSIILCSGGRGGGQSWESNAQTYDGIFISMSPRIPIIYESVYTHTWQD